MGFEVVSFLRSMSMSFRYKKKHTKASDRCQITKGVFACFFQFGG
jgi:hypothetical protein